MKRFARPLGIALMLAGFGATAADAGNVRVAGLAPYERPAGAPAIKESERGDAWRSTALRGVAQPVPESVTRFLDHQGAWYTPFTRPGMPGPYDLRGMHAPRAAAP